MRKNLKKLRTIDNDFTQEEMAEKIGVQRATYSAIECGTRDGRHSFWKGVQAAFNIPDSEMYELMKNE